jgi:NTP pyrophosphatase (non-canonical NTP hydrolase)
MIRQETIDRAIEISKKSFPDRTFDKDSLARLMGLLLEESGELSGAIRSYFGRKYRPDVATGNIENVKGEVGDILTVMNGVCTLFGITMDECLSMANDKLQRRYDQEQMRVAAAGLPPFERIDH